MLATAIILVFIGSIFAELSISIGKFESNNKGEGIYSMAFLNTLGAFLVFFTLFLLKHNTLTFSKASIPLVLLLIGFEFIQIRLANTAVIRADRSIFSLVKSLTIPLLIIVDVFMGYSLSMATIVGCTVLFSGIGIVFLHHTNKKQHLLYPILSAVNSVITISIYKYLITNYNSVITQQLIIYGCLLIYSVLGIVYKEKTTIKHIIKNKLRDSQIASSAFASVLFSFAYKFAPASLVIAVERSLMVLFSLISGRFEFKEHVGKVRIFSAFMIIIGLIIISGLIF